ncbi:hypothetical protein SAMN02927923_04230 [Microvirga guangxiensis]|uniref:Uncharacterized protein n=1 Tax=Microvirga guangxiensis TaxID=549386 RepID=A0A1G5LER9_9HYPH|nr:hypothetical protein SAMN02927923_04230 [Microvirga guangxiensis]
MPQSEFHWLSRRRLIAIVIGVAGAGLAGCSADVSYGSYRFGPGYETGQVYESRVYGSAQQGLGAENCRTVVRREADAFGRVSSREETVCQ